MSYTKLFSSILDSTIWLEPHHVVRVWITMLAMKDRDGAVASSIPGLAARARVSLPECEEALGKFTAPDPYSSTPDYEGRRIEPIAGGWRLLNHDKYRDKEDAEERRAKTAARVARLRERRKQPDVTPDVTLGNAAYREIRHADTDTDANTDREIRERAPAPTPVPAAPPPPAPVPLPARQKLNHDVWHEAKLAHELARSQGLDPGSRTWSAMPSGEGGRDLAARTVEQLELGNEAFVRAQHSHVINLRIAEAKELGSLAYFIPSRLYAKPSFDKALELSLDQAVEQARERRRRERRAIGQDSGGGGQIRIVRDDAEMPPPGLEDS